MANKHHRILIIMTGGTIAGEVSKEYRDDHAYLSPENIAPLLSPAISYINRHYETRISISCTELCRIDSSNTSAQHWVEISQAIKEQYDDHESFIILHGSNTLGYTCAALSFALPNLYKPVIITGAQVPINFPGSDAIQNLTNSLRLAVWDRCINPIKGVMAVYGSHIITGTRVKKETEFDYDAFTPFAVGALGKIGRYIHIDEQNLSRHLKYLAHSGCRPASKSSHLTCDNSFDMRIASLTEIPGMSPDIFAILVEHHDIQGFIFRAFGAGDASFKMKPGFQYLKKKEIPIVVTTQTPRGISNFQVNEPGEILRKERLAIPAFDMCIEAQTTKLAWLLAKKQQEKLTYNDICEQMIYDMKGEINVLLENVE